jgi:peptide/nickel transport system permease protein
MIYEGRAYLSDAWWISVCPGTALVITVIIINLIGDGLRDAWDTKLR